jgi:hypothetical protein
VQKALGWSVELVERRRKAAAEEVLKLCAQEWSKEGVAVNWEELLPPEGFQVLPKRRVVERTYSWIDQEDEQRLREVAREQRGVYLRGDESPDGEAFGSLTRLFGRFQKWCSTKSGRPLALYVPGAEGYQA